MCIIYPKRFEKHLILICYFVCTKYTCSTLRITWFENRTPNSPKINKTSRSMFFLSNLSFVTIWCMVECFVHQNERKKHCVSTEWKTLLKPGKNNSPYHKILWFDSSPDGRFVHLCDLQMCQFERVMVNPEIKIKS